MESKLEEEKEARIHLVLIVLAAIGQIPEGTDSVVVHLIDIRIQELDQRLNAVQRSRFRFHGIVAEAEVLKVGRCVCFDADVRTGQELDHLLQFRIPPGFAGIAAGKAVHPSCMWRKVRS